MKIDVERLRNDLLSDCEGAFYGGGFGGAMSEAADIKYASPQELADIAQGMGYNLYNYEVKD